MKLLSVLTLAFLLANKAPAQESKLADKKDRQSYSIGVNLGQSIGEKKIPLNLELFNAGFKDGFSNTPTLLSAEEVQKVMMELQNDLVEKHMQDMKSKSEKNLADGEKFLKANKKKKGVVTLPSGLQYRVINPGKGDSPKATDTVSANYRGKLIDDTEFDSSYSRNKPATIPVNAVIPGWGEALKLMKPGAKWEIFIPAKLAYGEHAPTPAIGPNATLKFEVELIGIEKPAALAEQAEPKEPELKE